MKTSIGMSLALVLLAVFVPRAESRANQKGNRRAQTQAVTGTYKYVLNSLEVVELPDHKVRISFAGYYPNDHSRVDTRNVGSFDETVPLKGRTATVKLQYGSDPCTIEIQFKTNKAIVSQGGSMFGCGFGFNVEADGTYIKVSSKPPILPPREPDQSQELSINDRSIRFNR